VVGDAIIIEEGTFRIMDGITIRSEDKVLEIIMVKIEDLAVMFRAVAAKAVILRIMAAMAIVIVRIMEIRPEIVRVLRDSRHKIMEMEVIPI